MPDLDRENQHDKLVRKHAESSTMLAILMAGIAALFIIGIATAFNYAANQDPANGIGAQAPAAAPAAPETTGSGSGAPAPRDSER